MAKSRSDVSRYPSNYGGDWVTAPQYIVECLCVLIAKQEKKGLDDRFWKHEPWNSIFRRQVPLAVSLLNEYPPEVVLATLRDRRCWKVKSLGAKWLLGPILKEKLRTYRATENMEQRTLRTTTTTDRPRQPNKNTPSLLSKLRGI
jgi:hypothetical protein